MNDCPRKAHSREGADPKFNLVRRSVRITDEAQSWAFLLISHMQDSLIGSSCDPFGFLRKVPRWNVITSREIYSSCSSWSAPGVLGMKGPKPVGGVTAKETDRYFETHSTRRKVNS